MQCCNCGYDEEHGVIVKSNTDMTKRFVCERCFINPSLWFGFVKWQQQQGLATINLSKKKIKRALKILMDNQQTLLKV